MRRIKKALPVNRSSDLKFRNCVFPRFPVRICYHIISVQVYVWLCHTLFVLSLLMQENFGQTYYTAEPIVATTVSPRETRDLWQVKKFCSLPHCTRKIQARPCRNPKKITCSRTRSLYAPPHRRTQGCTPSKFLAYLVILCFESRCLKQNTVARLKSKDLAPSKFLGRLRHCLPRTRRFCYLHPPVPGNSFDPNPRRRAWPLIITPQN